MPGIYRYSAKRTGRSVKQGGIIFVELVPDRCRSLSGIFLCNRKFLWNPLLHKKYYRTRRSGRWLPRQPRLGAKMCQGPFFLGQEEKVMYPSLEEVKNIASSGKYRRIPVSRELYADRYTPVEVLRLVPGAGAFKALFPGGRTQRRKFVRSHFPGEALGGGFKQQPGDGWRKGSGEDTGGGGNGANTGNRFPVKEIKDRNDQTGQKTRSQHTGGTICQREDLESTEASTFRKH